MEDVMTALRTTSDKPNVVEVTQDCSDDAIGMLLQRAGKLKAGDIDRIAKLQQKEQLRFGEAAQKLGLVSEADIWRALAQQFEYPCLKEVGTRSSIGLVAAVAPSSAAAEALRSLRSELLLRWFVNGRQILAVGSLGADEGADDLAANLAILFAQMGRKVLLIDANLRTPRQHEIFRLGKGGGLSDYLGGRSPTLKVHTIKPFHTLSVLGAGSPAPNPAELLARPGFGSLLSGLQASYDIILVDSAPAKVASDFQMIAAQAGGLLMATRRNVSRLSQMAEFKQKIVLAGAEVVGAVVLD